MQFAQPIFSHVKRQDPVIDGPAPQITEYKHVFFPRLACMSKTHLEAWIFDAVDLTTSNVAVTMTFFRDGTQAALGKCPIRTTFRASLPDGTKIAGELFATESVVEANPDARKITGKWRGGKKEEESGDAGWAQYEVLLDMSEATITINLPTIRGTLTLQQRGGRNIENSTESQLMGPGLSWVHSIPRAKALADFTFIQDGETKNLQFEGYGGKDYCRSTEPMQDMMEGTTYVRGHAGPYTFAIFRLFSRLHPGKTYTRATLVKEDALLFEMVSDDSVSLSDNYLSFRSTYSGRLRGDYSDHTTGYRIDFVSPGQYKHWSFELKHETLWWGMPTEAPPARTGNNGFISTVIGGEIGEPAKQGMATIVHIQMTALKTDYKGISNRQL
ncbi:Diels-Alderase [Trichophyton interdigitale]|nr:Diels-Alderase [Trichophyton interdigitale]KAG5218271.1 Diels-Alderase [Trichophyton interdigitale]KAG8206697.1 Diels-Alderase [Trichophyton interdigitale]